LGVVTASRANPCEWGRGEGAKPCGLGLARAAMRRFTPTSVEQIANLLHALGAGGRAPRGPTDAGRRTHSWDNQTYINSEENAH